MHNVGEIRKTNFFFYCMNRPTDRRINGNKHNNKKTIAITRDKNTFSNKNTGNNITNKLLFMKLK